MYPETKLYKSLTTGEFPIIVSLARHDLDLAKAALDGGAYALKTHLNAYHRATGDLRQLFRRAPILRGTVPARMPPAGHGGPGNSAHRRGNGRPR